MLCCAWTYVSTNVTLNYPFFQTAHFGNTGKKRIGAEAKIFELRGLPLKTYWNWILWTILLLFYFFPFLYFCVLFFFFLGILVWEVPPIESVTEGTSPPVVIDSCIVTCSFSVMHFKRFTGRYRCYILSNLNTHKKEYQNRFPWFFRRIKWTMRKLLF